ncbi:MAG TPA: chemotaxis protein CheA [Vicinamibacterales bacterium]|nr:chemotaxis protein CheA [Vicinamibacterales bacterium]
MGDANAMPPQPDNELGAFIADPELAGMFIADATDHLGTIETTLLKLEKSPTDLKLVNDIFRPFHTVKGNAGVLGIASIEEFAHKIETLLDLARSGKHPIGPAEIDLVLKTVDLLKLIIDELPARAAGKPVTDTSARRRELMARVDALIAGAPPPPSHKSGFLSPPPPPSNGGDGERGRAAAAARDEQSTVKVDTQKLDNLVDMVGELVIAQAILAEDPAIAGASDDRLTRRLAHVRRITSDLQRDTMAMRMVPIRQTFQKMARLARDLARKFEKPCTMALAGEDTELDRKVVEHLTDPLMHMVRNAIDHGIESPAARQAAGKPATAEVRLRAFHRAGFIVVEIADDGAGLDTDKILAKAVAQGLVPAGIELSPVEIHQLIFQPGFSTASQVTELSGRGVGMDVVRRNIEALRGRIDIHTELGKGTTFAIQLPLTLAIVDGILLGVGADRFVIPTFAVQESFRPQPEQVQSLQGQICMVQVRDRLYPLLHLGEVFGITGARQRISEGTVIICHDNGRSVALAVDELLGKQEVVIKSLGEMFKHIRGVAGGAILGDGRIGLILDTGGLVSLAGKSTSQVAA